MSNDHQKISICVKYLQESFSLWDAKKWVKIITRGDSAMFIYKVKVRCYDNHTPRPHVAVTPTTISQTDSRRFRVKFAPISPSTVALETCRQFSAVMAPLVVSIREMEAGGSAARDKDTSARDKAGSAPCALEGDSQFLGYGEDFESTQVISETQSSEYHQPNTAAGTGPILIPDESSLIPVPDIGKVLYYSSF